MVMVKNDFSMSFDKQTIGLPNSTLETSLYYIHQYSKIEYQLQNICDMIW